VDAGLKANEWIDDISSLLDGKGGGRAESAQATGNKPSNLAEAMAKATLFAQSKLGLSAPPPANSVKPGILFFLNWSWLIYFLKCLTFA